MNASEKAEWIIAKAERRIGALLGKSVMLMPVITDATYTPTSVKQAVARVCDVNAAAMETPSRKREIVEARQISMVIIREEFKHLSLKTVGFFFGGRDHTTVIHAQNTVADLLTTSKQFKYKHERCRKAVQQLKLGAGQDITRKVLMLPPAMPQNTTT